MRRGDWESGTWKDHECHRRCDWRINSVLTTGRRRQRIGMIRELPVKLEAALSGLDERQLAAASAEGEWSIGQVVHHMADADANFFVRMKLVLTDDTPKLWLFEQDGWARLADTAGVPIQPSLSILRGLHERWSVLLDSLPESAWLRQGVHPESGLVTLEDLLVTYTDHGEIHLEQIAKIRAANGW